MQSSSGPKLIKYEPALDGMRAIAVMAVIAFHVSPRMLPGGWIGVDVFFVLSGYLITTLLSQELTLSGTIDFKKFYMRRLLRLTPAFWVLLACITVGVVAFSHTNQAGDLRAVLISGLYLMNWNRAFDLFPQGQLGHTWSLAMEEQFYLLWPLIMLLTRRGQPMRWILGAIVAVTIWRIYLAVSGADPERTYNGFDSHGDALLIGCLLALLPMSARTAAHARTLAAVPVAGGILMVAELAHRTLLAQTFGFTVSSMLSAWLIIAALQPGWLRQLLSSRLLVYTGRISYGWYLWHFPALLLGQKFLQLQSAWGRTMLVLVAYVVAACSYHFIEQPFLRMKSSFAPSFRKTPTLQNEDGVSAARPL